MSIEKKQVLIMQLGAVCKGRAQVIRKKCKAGM